VSFACSAACGSESRDRRSGPEPEHEHGGSSGHGAGEPGVSSGGSGIGAAPQVGGSGGSQGPRGGSAPSSGGTSAGGESNEGGSGNDSNAGGEGGSGVREPPVVNGCVAYEDRTDPAASRTLSWDDGIGERPERCLTIARGQSVTWVGNLEDHPFDISPFVSGVVSQGGGAFTATFTTEGAFGFVCLPHSEMNGAIWVVAP
jgi:plastocyanin